MTVETLKQYRSLKKEIAEIDRQLEEHKVTDSVQGSMRDYPYVMQTHKVEGYNSDAQYLLKMKGNAVRQKTDIENYIIGIEDSKMRQILHIKFVEGMSIEKTAELVGYSKNHVGRLISSFLKDDV